MAHSFIGRLDPCLCWSCASAPSQQCKIPRLYLRCGRLLQQLCRRQRGRGHRCMLARYQHQCCFCSCRQRAVECVCVCQGCDRRPRSRGFVLLSSCRLPKGKARHSWTMLSDGCLRQRRTCKIRTSTGERQYEVRLSGYLQFSRFASEHLRSAMGQNCSNCRQRRRGCCLRCLLQFS